MVSRLNILACLPVLFLSGLASAEKLTPPEPLESVFSSEKIRSGELGFTKLVVCQRRQLSPSHVYTYHQEGPQPGGGLWLCDFSGEEVREDQDPP